MKKGGRDKVTITQYVYSVYTVCVDTTYHTNVLVRIVPLYLTSNPWSRLTLRRGGIWVARPLGWNSQFAQVHCWCDLQLHRSWGAVVSLLHPHMKYKCIYRFYCVTSINSKLKRFRGSLWEWWDRWRGAAWECQHQWSYWTLTCIR